MEIAVLLFIIAVIFISRSIKVVPQQNAWVVERLGKFHATLTPGLNFLVPFVDKVAYKHSLKEIPLDVPSQICITRATLAALGVPNDDPKAEAGRAVAEICLADLKDQIVDALAEGSSYTMTNACPVMLKGKAVTGLMQKRCEAAATAKK